MWWLSRRLGVERELCSDELAVSATGERLIYAQTLEHIAAGRQADIRPALAAYLQGESNMRLLQRIRNVLAPSISQRGHWPAGLVALGLAVGLWMLSISLLNTLTPSAYAAEPAQDEANADEDEQRDDASEEVAEEVKEEIEVEGEESEIEEEVEVEFDADLETLEDDIKRQVTEALQKALAQIEEKKSKQVEKPSLKAAGKIKKARTKAEQLAAEAHRKALLLSTEHVEKARLHAERIAEEAHKVALLQGEKARAQAEQMAAEVHKKMMLQHAQMGQARMMEELKKAHMHLQQEAQLQQKHHQDQLHHLQLERQDLDKAAFQRANDQRFEELAVMVKDLSKQVEMLHRELNSLRKAEDAKAGEKEGKDDAKDLLKKLLELESGKKKEEGVNVLPKELKPYPKVSKVESI